MANPVTSRELLIAVLATVVGIVVALALRLSLGWLRARRTRFRGEDLTLTILCEALPPSLVIAGLWIAEAELPLNGAVRPAVENILKALLILVLTLALAELLVRATRAFVLQRVGLAPSSSIFTTVVRIVVVIVGLLVVLQTVGVSITPLLGALGVGALAVALALQDTLTNLFAGINLLTSKKIEPGHYISLSTGQEGYVVDVNWRNTTIRATSNNMIVVPNALLASQAVTNYHLPETELSVVIQMAASYAGDLEQVERVTIEVAREVVKEVTGGVAEQEPLVRYHTFGESSIGFAVILRAREYTDQGLLTHELVKRLQRRFRAEGIEIPFPIRAVINRAAGDGAAAEPVVSGPLGVRAAVAAPPRRSGGKSA
jgi:small-conductance mechanosensitive channel